MSVKPEEKKRRQCGSQDVLEKLNKKILEYEVADLLKRQVVHDMNNIMQILYANIECNILMNNPDEEPIWELLLLNMRKTLVRLNPVEEKEQSVDLSVVVKGFVLLMQPRYPAVQFRFLSILETAFVQMTENQLFLILLNLFTNACYAMQNSVERKLDIILKRCPRGQKNYYCLSLHDTGCGIPVDLRVKVFQSYFTTKKSGNGLGLSMVKSTMDEIGGIIEIKSEEHIGTDFHLYFPVFVKSSD